MEAGRLAEARAELRAAMAVEPRNPELIVNLALVGERRPASGGGDRVARSRDWVSADPRHGALQRRCAV